MPELIAPPEPQLFSAYGTLLMQSGHRFARQLGRHYKPSVHGHKTWGSSFLLMDFLEQQRLLRRGTRVLELGCGWGATSVHCARRFKARVTGLDRDADVFPFMEVQASLNDVRVDTLESDFDGLRGEALSGFDVLLGADVCFWNELSDSLHKLVRRAARAGVSHVLIADPGRPPFHTLCRRLLKRYEGVRYDWYATEPRRYEGEILHLQLAAD